MPNYEFKCADGSDRHCEKTVSVFIELKGLTKAQLKEIEESGGTYISEKQVKSNNLSLSEEDKEQLKEEGSVFYEVYLENICGPCGSDQDYDDEGNNITAL